MISPTIISKLPAVGTTIFTEINTLATIHNAINLGQGFPDFMMDPRLIALVAKAMQDGHNQYTHMNGLPILREAIANKIEQLYAAVINADSEITVTPGGTYAIYTALTTLLNFGDEVIVFEPAYDSYIPNILLNGGVPVLIPLLHPSYNIDWELVKKSITAKTKLIVLNNPHNPSGSILSNVDIDELRSIVKDTGIFILSDEVYEHLVFDKKKHESILRYPDLLERSFVCFSFGKTFHCTGWKLGYCVAPATLMKEYRKMHQFNSFSCNTPVQYGLAYFLNQSNNYINLGEEVQQKRDYFQNLMMQTKFKPIASSGSYFQLYSYAAISDETERDFAIRLIKDVGVATIPVSAFYTQPVNNKVIRFCFVKKEDTLEIAVERLMKLA